MITEVEAGKLAGSKTVAELFGLTMRRVQQLAKDGIISVSKEGNIQKYDLALVTRQYIRHLSEMAKGRYKDKAIGSVEARSVRLSMM